MNDRLLYTKEQITPDFLRENDGKLVWIRDDYLCMNGIQGPGELYDFLEHVSEVKAACRRAGTEFTA